MRARICTTASPTKCFWRGQDGQNETEQPDHFASLGDSITSSTRIMFLVHTADDPPPRLCLEPADPQADRGELRLDQDRREARPAETARSGPDRMGIHLRRGSLQSCPPAQATGGGNRMTPRDHASLVPADRPRNPTTNGDEAVIRSGSDLSFQQPANSASYVIRVTESQQNPFVLRFHQWI
jgi:hypothetical protein